MIKCIDTITFDIEGFIITLVQGIKLICPDCGHVTALGAILREDHIQKYLTCRNCKYDLPDYLLFSYDPTVGGHFIKYDTSLRKYVKQNCVEFYECRFRNDFHEDKDEDV